MNRTCTLHSKQTLISFCDTCHDAVCSLCIKLGPHADIRHKVMPLQQAAQIRQMFYFAFRDKEVHPTIQKVLLHLEALRQKQVEVAKERKVIEKDIAIQFQGITSRVNAVVSKRIIKKQTQIKNYQQVLNRIEDLVYSFDGVVQFPQRFLLSYRQFHQQLKHLQTMTLNIHSAPEQTLALKTTDMKAISTSWKIQPAQPQQLYLPREMALSFAKANQLPLYIEKNEFLNALIGKSVEDYHRELSKARRGVVETKKKILHLYNDQNEQLLKMHRAMVCAFCLAAFSMSQVNQACSHNKSFKAEPSYKDIEIPPEVRGCKMHYWVSARLTERPIPDLKTHTLVRILHKKQYLNSLKDIREVGCQLKRYDINKDKEGAYLLQFKKDDPDGRGKVTPLAFLFIMTNKFSVSETQVEVLSNLCLNQEQNLVDYTKMEEILRDPIELHRAFEAEEEEMEKAKPMAPPSFKFRY